MKLYKVTLPELWVVAAGDSDYEAAGEALYDFKELMREMHARELEAEEITPGDPNFEMYFETWGGDEDELDPAYFTEED